MKRIISITLAVLCIAATLCSCSKKADESATTAPSATVSETGEKVLTSQNGEFDYVVLADGTAKIVKYKKALDKDLEIPVTIDSKYKVTVIGENTFTDELKSDKNVTVKLPRTLTKIESRAFNKSNVYQILFHEPNEDIETVIESYAFSDCDNLTAVKFSSSIKRLEACTFYHGNMPKFITFSVDPNYIDAMALDTGKSYKELKINHIGDISNFKNLEAYAALYNIELVLKTSTVEK